MMNSTQSPQVQWFPLALMISGVSIGVSLNPAILAGMAPLERSAALFILAALALVAIAAALIEDLQS